MKYAAILGFLGLVSIATVTLTHKPQSTEPVVSGSEIQTEGSISVPEKSETKTETPSTPKSSPSPKSLAIKLADLVVPKTEEEQDAAIDQNTLKNVEQDSRLDNLDSTVNNLQNPVNNPVTSPAPEPVIQPEPDPIIKQDYLATRGGVVYCEGFDNYFGCGIKNSHELANSTITLTIDNQTVSKTSIDGSGLYLRIENVPVNTTFRYKLTLDNDSYSSVWETEYFLKN